VSTEAGRAADAGTDAVDATVEAPVTEAPVVETPLVETAAVETPAAETPVVESAENTESTEG
jgi:ribonuclease E